MEPTLEQMAWSLAESGDYRLTRRLEPQTEYHPPDNSPKLVAAVVDVETTGTNPDRDRIIELAIYLFEYGRHDGRIYKVLGSWEWFEDPGFSIPPVPRQSGQEAGLPRRFRPPAAHLVRDSPLPNTPEPGDPGLAATRNPGNVG
jgi:hypothetical protein